MSTPRNSRRIAAGSNLGGPARDVLRNSAARLLIIPIAGLLGVLNTSVIIGSTDAATYGIVSTVATLVLMLPFVDFGVGSAVTTAASNAVTEDDKSRRMFAATFFRASRVLRLSGAAVATVALVALFSGSWSWILGRTLSFDSQAWISCALIIFAVSMPFSVGVRVLQGLGHNQLAIVVMSLASAYTVVASLILSWLGSSGLAFVISSYLGLFSAHLTCYTLCFRKYKRQFHRSIRSDYKDPSVPSQKRLLSGSKWMFIVMAFLPLTTESARLILSHLGSARELAVYALAAQLYAMAWSVVNATSGSMWRDFVRLRGDPAATIAHWNRMTKVLALLAVAGSIGIVSIGPEIASLISHGAISVPRPLMAAFGLILLAQALHLPGGAALTMPHELRWQAIWVGAMAVFAISCSLILTGRMGVYGPALSIAIGVFLFQVVPDRTFMRRKLRQRGVLAMDAKP